MDPQVGGSRSAFSRSFGGTNSAAELSVPSGPCTTHSVGGSLKT
uniref:Uncharacterized protein n=1 Tax=Arundo donax TaxID=35708 RepID=A0A0A8YWT4_ARUDO